MNSFFGHNLPCFVPMGNGKLTAKQLNNHQYWEIFNRLTNVGLSRFKWNGLPDTCRPEILEETLFFYGCALFMNDPDLGFIHTPVDLIGPFNVYYESIVRHAYSFEYNKEFTIDNSVVIKANHSMMPDYLTVWNYTPKIANSLRAIDVHTETLKRPFLIKAPEKMKQSVKSAVEKISDNEVCVIGEKMGDDTELQVIPLVVNSHLTEMWANVKNYLNQVYSSLGVKNSYTEKRERMITSESEGESNAIRHTLESELYERQLACERINKMFGLNVSVEANEVEIFMDELIEAYAARVTGMTNQQEEVVEEVDE